MYNDTLDCKRAHSSDFDFVYYFCANDFGKQTNDWMYYFDCAVNANFDVYEGFDCVLHTPY